MSLASHAVTCLRKWYQDVLVRMNQQEAMRRQPVPRAAGKSCCVEPLEGRVFLTAAPYDPILTLHTDTRITPGTQTVATAAASGVDDSTTTAWGVSGSNVNQNASYIHRDDTTGDYSLHVEFKNAIAADNQMYLVMADPQWVGDGATASFSKTVQASTDTDPAGTKFIAGLQSAVVGSTPVDTSGGITTWQVTGNVEGDKTVNYVKRTDATGQLEIHLNFAIPVPDTTKIYCAVSENYFDWVGDGAATVFDKTIPASTHAFFDPNGASILTGQEINVADNTLAFTDLVGRHVTVGLTGKITNTVDPQVELSLVDWKGNVWDKNHTYLNWRADNGYINADGTPMADPVPLWDQVVQVVSDHYQIANQLEGNGGGYEFDLFGINVTAGDKDTGVYAYADDNATADPNAPYNPATFTLFEPNRVDGSHDGFLDLSVAGSAYLGRRRIDLNSGVDRVSDAFAPGDLFADGSTDSYTLLEGKTGLTLADVNSDNKIELDLNNDGIADRYLDVDNDGKPELDLDGNGKAEWDFNQDGVADSATHIGRAYITTSDGSTDGDLMLDTNLDGKADRYVDYNGDGLPEIDTNGDGVPELDINHDGVQDTVVDLEDSNGNAAKNLIDNDGDGKADFDVNGDGTPDVFLDLDNDGLVDTWTTDGTGKITSIVYGDGHTQTGTLPGGYVDLAGKGIASADVILTDANGTAIHLIDLNGDGKPDFSGSSYKTAPVLDINHDGRVDKLVKVKNTTLIDNNGDGLVELDADGNGTLDMFDDANGDGNPDVYVQNTNYIDINGDGNAEFKLYEDDGTPIDKGGKAGLLYLTDFNHDQLTDYLRDANRDGTPDAFLNGGAAIDIDGDGQAEFTRDTKGNTAGTVYVDLNGDGVADTYADGTGDGTVDTNYIDLNGDQRADVLLSGGTVNIYVGGFTPYTMDGLDNDSNNNGIGSNTAGLKTTGVQDLGFIHFGGLVTGHVAVNSNVQELYVGGSLTGTATGVVGFLNPVNNEVLTATDPGNFTINGNVGRLVSGTRVFGGVSSATGGLVYWTNQDLVVNGQLGELAINTTNDLGVGEAASVGGTIYGHVTVNGKTLGVGTVLAQNEWENVSSSIASPFVQFTQSSTGQQALYLSNNDTPKNAQIVGTSSTSDGKGSNDILINGSLDGAANAGAGDNVDYYGTGLLADQTITAQLLTQDVAYLYPRGAIDVGDKFWASLTLYRNGAKVNANPLIVSCSAQSDSIPSLVIRMATAINDAIAGSSLAGQIVARIVGDPTAVGNTLPQAIKLVTVAQGDRLDVQVETREADGSAANRQTFGVLRENLYLGVFDPDDRLVATDDDMLEGSLSRPNGESVSTLPQTLASGVRGGQFQVTTTQAGLYRFAVGTPGNVQENRPSWWEYAQANNGNDDPNRPFSSTTNISANSAWNYKYVDYTTLTSADRITFSGTLPATTLTNPAGAVFIAGAQSATVATNGTTSGGVTTWQIFGDVNQADSYVRQAADGTFTVQVHFNSAVAAGEKVHFVWGDTLDTTRDYTLSIKNVGYAPLGSFRAEGDMAGNTTVNNGSLGSVLVDPTQNTITGDGQISQINLTNQGAKQVGAAGWVSSVNADSRKVNLETTLDTEDSKTTTLDYFKNAAIYIYQGTAKGEMRLITGSSVVNGVVVVSIDTPFSVQPDTSSVYIIGPAVTITSQGLGRGATAYSIVDNFWPYGSLTNLVNKNKPVILPTQIGTVSALNVVGRGNGYTGTPQVTLTDGSGRFGVWGSNGGDNLATAVARVQTVSPVNQLKLRVVTGDMKSVVSWKDFAADVRVTDGVVGLIRAGSDSAYSENFLETQGNNYYTNNTILGNLYLRVESIISDSRNLSLANKGRIQFIESDQDLHLDLASDASTGTIRVGRDLWGLGSNAAKIYVNRNHAGLDGTLDLLDVRRDIYAPYISHGRGGNIRYVMVGRNVYNIQGVIQPWVTLSAGQSYQLRDDSGATFTLTPVSKVVQKNSPTTSILASGSTTNWLSPAQLQFRTIDIHDGTTGGVVGASLTDAWSLGGSIQVSANNNQNGGSVEIGRIGVEDDPILGANRYTQRSTTTDASGNTILQQWTAATDAAAGGTFGTTQTSSSSSSGLPTGWVSFSVPTTTAAYPTSSNTSTPAASSTGARDIISAIYVTGSTRIDVLSACALVGVSNQNGFQGYATSNLTYLYNDTGGELVSVAANNIGELRSTGLLGVTCNSTGQAMAPHYQWGITGLFSSKLPQASLYPFMGQRTLVAALGDVGSIKSGDAMGNIYVAGNVGSITADYANNGDSVFRGIVAPIFAAKDINSVNIGDGLAPSGNGEFAQGGIYSLQNIGNITGNTNAHIRGDIVGLQSVGNITLTGGSIINAKILSGLTSLKDSREFTPVQPGSLSGGKIGNITLSSKDGIIGSVIGAQDVGNITITGGFGLLNSYIFSASVTGTIGNIAASGYGIRNVRFDAGRSQGSITATSSGEGTSAFGNLSYTDLLNTGSVTGFRSYTKPVSTYYNRTTLVNKTNPTRFSVPMNSLTAVDLGAPDTQLGYIQYVNGLALAGSLGMVDAYKLTDSTFNYNNVMSGFTVRTASIACPVRNVKILGGDLGTFKFSQDFGDDQSATGWATSLISMSGKIGSATISGNLMGIVQAIGSNGRIDSLTIGKNLTSTGIIRTTGSVGSIRVTGDSFGTYQIEQASGATYALQSLYVGRDLDLQSASLFDLWTQDQAYNIGRIGAIQVGRNFSGHGVTFVASRMDSLTVGGNLDTITIQTDLDLGNITLGSMTNSTLQSIAGNVGNVTINGVMNGSTIDASAGNAGTLSLRGDMNSSSLTVGVKTNAVNIYGKMNNSHLATGNVSTLYIQKTVEGGSSITTGDVTSLTITGAVTGTLGSTTLQAGNVTRLSTGALTNATFNTGSIGNAYVYGAMNGSGINASGNIGSVYAFGAMASSNISATGTAGVLYVSGAMTNNSSLSASGKANTVYVLGAMTSSNLAFGGAGGVYVYGAMTSSNINSSSSVGNIYAFGAMNNSNVSVTGTAGVLYVSGAMTNNSSLSASGKANTVYVFGAMTSSNLAFGGAGGVYVYGAMTSSNVNSSSSVGNIYAFGAMNNSNVSVTGTAGVLYVSGAMTNNSSLSASGKANTVYVFGAMTSSNLAFGGAGGVYVYGAMTSSNVNSSSSVGNIYAFGAMNNSNVSVTGTAGVLYVSGAMTNNSSLSASGKANTVYVFGNMSSSNLTLGSAGGVYVYGKLTSSNLLVTGAVPTVYVQGAVDGGSSVQTGDITSLTISGTVTGGAGHVSVQTGNAGTINITGTVTGAVGQTTLQTGSITNLFTGALTNATLRAGGSIELVYTPSMTNSRLYVGIDPAVTDLPAVASDFTSPFYIGRLYLTGGVTASSKPFTNSVVAASNIKSFVFNAAAPTKFWADTDGISKTFGVASRVAVSTIRKYGVPAGTFSDGDFAYREI